MTKNRYGATRAGALLLLLAGLVLAHEGHQSIKTRGVAFGPKTGHLLLEPPARRAVGVATSKVDFGSIEEILPVPIQVVLPPSRHGFATALSEGILERIGVKPGDRVQAGDILGEFTSTGIEQDKLSLAHRTLERNLARQNLERARVLGETIVAGRELLELEAGLEELEIEILVLRERLAALGLTQADLLQASEGRASSTRLTIKAPISGTVLHVDMPVGGRIAPDQHLVEIQDSSELLVQGDIPESRIPEVGLGLEVRASFPAWPGRTFAGRIELLAPEVSPSRTRRAWSTVSNIDGLLAPGIFGVMEIVTGRSENATVAPLEAIIEEGVEKYALVLAKDRAFVRIDADKQVEEYVPAAREGHSEVGVFERKPVVTGRSDGRQVEIIEGLYPGDLVVTVAGHELSALYAQGVLKLSEEVRKNIRLETVEVDLRTLDDVVRVNATLRSAVGGSVDVAARLEGKIRGLLVRPGQVVKAGEVVAEIRSIEFDHLQSELRRALLRERLLASILERTRGLSDSGVVPRKDRLKLESDHLELKQAVLNLRNRLELAGAPPGKIAALVEQGERMAGLEVVSPISGTVSAVPVAIGGVVHSGDPILTVVDGSALWVEARVFEGDFQRVLGGNPGKEGVLRLVGVGEREVRARLTFSAGALEGDGASLPLYAVLPNEEGTLLPGMVGRLALVVGSPPDRVIAAPARALLGIGGRRYAFVSQGKSFQRVQVETGREDAAWVEIRRGLFPGDQVAVSGVNELNTSIMLLK